MHLTLLSVIAELVNCHQSEEEEHWAENEYPEEHEYHLWEYLRNWNESMLMNFHGELLTGEKLWAALKTFIDMSYVEGVCGEKLSYSQWEEHRSGSCKECTEPKVYG